MDGFLLIDKPVGPTSHDIVDLVRKAASLKRVGHSGTLDPLASGLLILALGASTKQLSHFLGAAKSYQAELTLGASSTTDDAEGVKTILSDREPLGAEIEQILVQFRGRLEQTPPVYSAVKRGGQKSYLVARRGGSLELMPRRVEVYDLQLLSYRYPRLTLSAHVSPGTYLRALARDLGQRLSTGAYLSALRRIRIGEVSVEEAITVRELRGNWIRKILKYEDLAP